MSIGIGSSWNDPSTEYITLDSKEDLFKAYLKLSAKDKRWLEIKIRAEKMKRLKNYTK